MNSEENQANQSNSSLEVKQEMVANTTQNVETKPTIDNNENVSASAAPEAQVAKVETPTEAQTASDVTNKPKTMIKEEIVIDANSMPRLVRKEVPIEEEVVPEVTIETPKKKSKFLPILLILILLCGGGSYYYFFVYKKAQPEEEVEKPTEVKQEEKNEYEGRTDIVFFYLRRDTGTVLVSSAYTKQYKLLGTYTCASKNKCKTLVSNNQYVVLKDDNDVILYDIEKSKTEKLDQEYSKYTEASFRTNKDKTETLGIDFTLDKEKQYYQIKRVEG